MATMMRKLFSVVGFGRGINEIKRDRVDLFTSLFITGVINYFFNNVLVMAISIDNLCCAAKFIKHNFDPSITSGRIVTLSNDLYVLGTLERYVYYLILYVINFFVNVLLLNGDYMVIKCGLVVTVIPVIFNCLAGGVLSGMFGMINDWRNKFLHMMYLNYMAFVLKKVVNAYVGEGVIPRNDVEGFVNNFDATSYDAIGHLKNVLMVMGMMYLRNVNIAYYKLTKYVYFYGYGGEYVTRLSPDAEVAVEGAKEMLINVIRGKEYTEIVKPMFIQNVIFLYYNGSGEGALYKLFVRMNFKFLFAMTLWIVGSFESGWLSAGMVIGVHGLLYWVREFRKGGRWWGVEQMSYLFLSSLVGVVVALVSKWPFVLSFVCVFSYDLLCNEVVMRMCDASIRKIWWCVKCLHGDWMIYVRYMLIMGVCCVPSFGKFVTVMTYIVCGRNFRNVDRLIDVLGYIGIMNNEGMVCNLCLLCYCVCVFHVLVYLV